MVDASRSGGCPRWAKALLLISLTGNLIVAGLVIGTIIRPHKNSEGNWMMSIVPVEKRDSAMELIAKSNPRIEALRDQRKELRREMMTAVSAEPFEPEEMAKKMEFHRQVSNEQKALIHAQLVELFAMMSHEERVEAAERMQRLFARRPPPR